MPLNPLNHHYAMENPASIYDEEALTALELAGRTTARVNEAVEAFNELEVNTHNHLETQDRAISKMNNETMPEKVTAEVQRKIDSGEFDQAISNYMDDLNGRVDNLLGKVTTGTTTMDAEIIDGRRGENGTTYTNIGEAIRDQLGKTIHTVNTTATDANEMLATGFYFKGGSQTWANVPETMATTAGAIISFAPDIVKWPQRVVQMAIDYNGYIHTRSYAGWFSAWHKFSSDSEFPPVQFNEIANTQEWDIDTFTNTGFYMFGSSHRFVNAPTDNGLLIVFRGKADYNLYHMWIDYHTSTLYVRNMDVNIGWREWKRLLGQGDVVPSAGGGSGHVYTVTKVDDTKFYINKAGSNGYIRYTYARHVKEDVNQDIIRLYSVEHVDANGTVNIISASGADLEGVVYLSGEADHVGGIHGDEKTTEYYIFIDGKQYTLETIPDMECNDIRVIVASNITHCDTTNVCMKKIKQTTFDKDGVHTNCEWEALEELTFLSIRSCMFSIEKANFTHYYDSNVNRIPTQRAEASTTQVRLSSDANITDMYYVGNVVAHHWAGERGGDKSGYSTILQDYGGRLKTYFNCYDGYTASAGEKLHAVNHFTVDC